MGDGVDDSDDDSDDDHGADDDDDDDRADYDLKHFYFCLLCTSSTYSRTQHGSFFLLCLQQVGAEATLCKWI